MNKFKIVVYEKNGNIPFENYLNSINKKAEAKIHERLLLLEDFGNLLREPYSKEIDDGIYELRVRSNGLFPRIIYFFFLDKTIVITHGFNKKTNKTPKKEIELAKNYRKDWLKRHGL